MPFAGALAPCAGADLASPGCCLAAAGGFASEPFGPSVPGPGPPPPCAIASEQLPATSAAANINRVAFTMGFLLFAPRGARRVNVRCFAWFLFPEPRHCERRVNDSGGFVGVPFHAFRSLQVPSILKEPARPERTRKRWTCATLSPPGIPAGPFFPP